MRKTIAVDVDNVVVDLARDWVDFINKSLPQEEKITLSDVRYSYNFHDAVSGFLSQERVSSFWKCPNLYDNATPIEGSVEVLASLSNDFNIVFATHVEGNHAKSKFDFLKRHFPFMDGFIATREKHFVKCDMLIDDRVKNLVNLCNKTQTPVLFHTNYDQDVEMVGNIVTMVGWDERFIREKL